MYVDGCFIKLYNKNTNTCSISGGIFMDTVAVMEDENNRCSEEELNILAAIMLQQAIYELRKKN